MDTGGAEYTKIWVTVVELLNLLMIEEMDVSLVECGSAECLALDSEWCPMPEAPPYPFCMEEHLYIK